MPTCSICSHPQRAEIESQMTNRVPLRRIASQHGTTDASLRRHRDNCLAGAIQAAQSAQATVAALTVMQQINSLQTSTLRILRTAERSGKLGTAVMAIAAARQNLELIAKLTGELDERPQVNILLHPDWLGLKQTLLDALAVHPTALEAVYAALEPAAGS